MVSDNQENGDQVLLDVGLFNPGVTSLLRIQSHLVWHNMRKIK